MQNKLIRLNEYLLNLKQFDSTKFLTVPKSNFINIRQILMKVFSNSKPSSTPKNRVRYGLNKSNLCGSIAKFHGKFTKKWKKNTTSRKGIRKFTRRIAQ